MGGKLICSVMHDEATVHLRQSHFIILYESATLHFQHEENLHASL